VAAALGRSFSAGQRAELVRPDIASWLHLQEGTVALIEDLAAAGYRLALLSNAPADIAEVAAELPVTRVFEHQAFSCFLGSVKPEPECYRAVLAMLGAQPGDVVFLDDRPEKSPGRRHWASAVCVSPHRKRRGPRWPGTASPSRRVVDQVPAGAGSLCHDERITTLGVCHFVSNLTRLV
jgi:FMN phosphatase YigB (HAD superfamily)